MTMSDVKPLHRIFPVVLSIVLLALAHDAAAQEETIEIRVTGEHHLAAGDTTESAAAIALVDARQKAVQAAAAQLQQSARLKALGLKPGHLEAFTAVLVRAGEQSPLPTPLVTGTAHRVELRARLNAGDAGRRVVDLSRDEEAAYELVAAWTETERLVKQLSDLTRRRSGAASDDAARSAREQTAIVSAIEVQALTAQAYAAFVRNMSGPVGARVWSEEGRERAKQIAETALVRAPESPHVHVLRGDLWIEDKQPVQAEAEYRKALMGSPSSSPTRTKLAAALRLQGRFPEALAELREALRIDPAFARAHSDLGMILREEKKLPEAIAAYREAIRLAPDSVDAHNGLAVTLANSGNLEEAITHFREIIRIDPDLTLGYYNVAYALADLDRDAEAAAALREVIRIYPDHYNARYNLGEMFRLEQKFDDAATQFREYLRLAPDTPQNQRNITRARRLVRQYEDPNAPPLPQAPMRK